MLEVTAKQLSAQRPDQQTSVNNTSQALESVACDVVLSSDLLRCEESRHRCSAYNGHKCLSMHCAGR